MNVRTIVVLTAISIAVWATPASAQSVCSKRATFIEHLGQEYSETTSAVGVSSDGSVVEVLTSEGGSWSILVTNPEGVTCLVASGDSWEDLKIELDEPAA